LEVPLHSAHVAGIVAIVPDHMMMPPTGTAPSPAGAAGLSAAEPPPPYHDVPGSPFCASRSHVRDGGSWPFEAAVAIYDEPLDSTASSGW
jgi:hypothetical protein